MFSNFSLNIMHQITTWLLEPVVWALLSLVLLAIFETGIAVGEYFGGIKKWVEQKNISTIKRIGKQRIERTDFITRLAPMLGLMGTLIPLGPGLGALGDGNLKVLTTAITVAFDTTIIGLLSGMIGFVLGRLRRRWYDQAIEIILEENSKTKNTEHTHG
jgi:biopolymer transport protein ExbB/TolQ